MQVGASVTTSRPAQQCQETFQLAGLFCLFFPGVVIFVLFCCCFSFGHSRDQSVEMASCSYIM